MECVSIKTEYKIRTVANLFNKLGNLLDKKLHLIFLIVMTPILFSSVFIYPPFQSPDEQAHYAKAYEISRGRFKAHRKIDVNNNVIVGNKLDESFGEFGSIFGNLAFHPENKVNSEQLNRIANITFSGKEKVYSIPNMASYGPFFYLPQGIGIYIGKKISNKPILGFYLARIANVIVYLILATAALYYCTKNKLFNLLILTAPMTLSLTTSCSMDGIFIASSVLLLVCFSENVRSLKIICYFLICAIILQKAAYAPFYLLVFAGYYFKYNKREARKKLILIILPLLFLLIWYLIGIHPYKINFAPPKHMLI